MRTATLALSLAMAVTLLGCEGGATSVAPGTPPGMVTPLSASPDAPSSLEEEQVSEDSEASASSQETLVGSPVTPAVQSAIAYLGPTSILKRGSSYRP